MALVAYEDERVHKLRDIVFLVLEVKVVLPEQEQSGDPFERARAEGGQLIHLPIERGGDEDQERGRVLQGEASFLQE